MKIKIPYDIGKPINRAIEVPNGTPFNIELDFKQNGAPWAVPFDGTDSYNLIPLKPDYIADYDVTDAGKYVWNNAPEIGSAQREEFFTEYSIDGSKILLACEGRPAGRTEVKLLVNATDEALSGIVSTTPMTPQEAQGSAWPTKMVEVRLMVDSLEGYEFPPQGGGTGEFQAENGLSVAQDGDTTTYGVKAGKNLEVGLSGELKVADSPMLSTLEIGLEDGDKVVFDKTYLTQVTAGGEERRTSWGNVINAGQYDPQPAWPEHETSSTASQAYAEGYSEEESGEYEVSETIVASRSYVDIDGWGATEAFTGMDTRIERDVSADTYTTTSTLKVTAISAEGENEAGERGIVLETKFTDRPGHVGQTFSSTIMVDGRDVMGEIAIGEALIASLSTENTTQWSAINVLSDNVQQNVSYINYLSGEIDNSNTRIGQVSAEVPTQTAILSGTYTDDTSFSLEVYVRS